MNPILVGVIGGSGLYNMKELTDLEEIKIETPFGPPSDNYVIGTLAKRRVAYIRVTATEDVLVYLPLVLRNTP